MACAKVSTTRQASKGLRSCSERGMAAGVAEVVLEVGFAAASARKVVHIGDMFGLSGTHWSHAT